MSNVLEVNDLKIEFPIDEEYFTAVQDVSFHIEAGETLGIVGESGCGKSVTSLSIMRLLGSSTRVSGEVLYTDRSLLSLSEPQMRKVRGNEIGMIFQEPMTSLNPVHKIGRQVGETLFLHRGMNSRQARRASIEMLERVGIPRAEQIVDEYPHQLSGGMRQRVMIAIAMACNPSLLIADEPTTALDVTIQAQILELMRDLAKDNGTSILLITHDLGVVAEMCDRVVVMYAGHVVEQGSVRQIFHNPQHPYTRGLLNSMPKLTSERSRLEPIQGNVPSLQNMPEGCRFAPRCPFVMDKCLSNKPPLYGVEDGHKSRCFLQEEAQ